MVLSHGCPRSTELTEQEDQMYVFEEEDSRAARDKTDLSLLRTPPLRLAGIDEDDTWEPHLVRGID
jgi:hypothetical protein